MDLGRLEKACNGYPFSKGGMNIPELKNALIEMHPEHTDAIKAAISRKDIEVLCHQIHTFTTIAPKAEPRTKPSRPKPEPKAEPSRPHIEPRPEPSRPQIEDPFTNCENETDYILFEDINKVEREKLIKLPSPTKRGKFFCDDILNLVAYLKSTKKNENPFNKQPLWKNRDEFNIIINHSGTTNEEKKDLLDIFYPSQLPEWIIKVVEDYPDIFSWIGIVAHACLADYTKDFRVAAAALAYLTTLIEALPEIRKKEMYNLMNPKINKTLGEILRTSNEMCIHGVGGFLIVIYLSHWYEITNNGINLPLIDNIVQVSTFKRTCLLVTNSPMLINIYSYTHDYETKGRSSELFIIRQIYIDSILPPRITLPPPPSDPELLERYNTKWQIINAFITEDGGLNDKLMFSYLTLQDTLASVNIDALQPETSGM